MGTNNETSTIVLGKLRNWRQFIEDFSRVSCLLMLTLTKTNKHLYGLQLDVTDKGNITSNH